ncbi:GFA family protein [bacterium SCSIO 12696]|nr:GFA family protein [bacterium SCSIO 12696]
MNKLAKGSCNCGCVEFEISLNLKDVYICHCSICRKSTGSGGIAVSVVPNENFNWAAGQEYIKTWHKPNHDWETSFCTNCGSPLPGKNDESSTYIPVSLLNSGSENLKIKKHLFLDSCAVWEDV